MFIPAPPPKSALKTKRRGSLLVVNTPPPISRHVSISQSPDINHELEAIQQSHKEIESVREEEEAIPEHHRVCTRIFFGCNSIAFWPNYL